MNNVLYLTRNGLLEPLGRSQVFAYLRGLSREYAITLITYEKPEDWADSARLENAQTECDRHGIRWVPQRFHAKPRVLAPALSMVRMTWIAWREVRAGRARLIHARSYIPAAAALAVHRLTGVPFIFDMRALWPEELITAGRLRRGSLLHRKLVRAERLCLRRAAAVVSLTKAAVDHLRQVYPRELSGQKVVIIPTCADLDRFRPPAESPDGPSIYGCVGTVLSGWFRLDWLSRFFEAVARRDSDARFHVVTRDDPSVVRQRLDTDRVLERRLAVYSKSPEAIHGTVQQQRASVMFYAGGAISELGRSPTRMGEVLGCGIPVVANEGVGDVARIIREYRVGVLATDSSAASMNATVRELESLLTDPDLCSRCREAAEEVFSLEAGTEAYRTLYRWILGANEPLAMSGADD